MDRVRESPTLSIAFLVLLSSSGVHAHDQSNNYFISSQERLWGFKKNKTLPLISLSLSLSLCFNPQSPVNLFPVQCLGKGKSSFLWASLFEQCLSCSWSGIFFFWDLGTLHTNIHIHTNSFLALELMFNQLCLVVFYSNCTAFVLLYAAKTLNSSQKYCP